LASQNERCPASVLHIGKYYAPHVGGMETHVKDLVRHQSAVMRVKVVVANDHPVTRTEMLDGATITRVACFGSVASQPICPSLPWKLSGHSECLVHMQLPNPWAAHAYLMSGHKGKLIITHQSDMLRQRHLRKIVGPFVRRAMKRAAAIIVTSKRYLDSSDELIDFRNKCHVVPLGTDLEPYGTEAPEKVRAVHEKYGRRFIIAVGRLVPYKGFEVLLAAMKDVDVPLLLIGTGPLQQELKAKIEALGVTKKVHMLGHVDDTVPYYRAAQMLVLPSVSRAESFGLVQVEAMAAGIPVINTDIASGVPEVSVDGVTGITVPPSDPGALAHAINFLLRNEETRVRYGSAAKRRAHEEFSVQRMAQKTLSVYESVF
jgi:glycosyltransferase involved in cell wall biosynthesis